MNQNQKISIFDNPQLRKEIGKKLANKLNTYIKDENQKFTDAEMDAFFDDPKIVSNYKKNEQLKKVIQNKKDIRDNPKDTITVDPDFTGLRWSYLTFNAEDNIENEAKNRETALLIQNTNTRKKLKNKLVLEELNIDIDLLFPTSDEEALDQYEKNTQNIETGFLLTNQDLLSDIKDDNPELNFICEQNSYLYLGNYAQTVQRYYSYILSSLLPMNGKTEDTLRALSKAGENIVKIISPYYNQVKEFEEIKELDPLRAGSKLCDFFSEAIKKREISDPKAVPMTFVIKDMYKDGIIQNGMPLKSVFKQDGKEISILEAAQNYDTKKKEFINGVTIEEIDPKKLQRINNIVKYDNVLGNIAYYKHLQNDLKIKAYEGTYDDLASSLEQYIALYDSIEQEANKKIAEDNNLNLKNILLEEIAKNNDFVEMENKIQSLIPEFSKDIILTNAKYKDLDIQIHKLEEIHAIYNKNYENFDPIATVRDHTEAKELYEQLDTQIKSIKNQRMLMSQSGNKEDIKKANEEYYKAFEKLVNTQIEEKIDQAFKSYSSDKLNYRSYMAIIKKSDAKTIVQNMEFYSKSEEPKDEFEQERLKQMKDFIQEFNKNPNQDLKTLLKDNNFILANRIMYEHYKVRNDKERLLHRTINDKGIIDLKEFINDIENNQFKEDYTEIATNLKSVLSQLSIIDKKLEKFSCEAERADEKVKEYTELFCKEPVKSLCDSILGEITNIYKGKEAFTKELKNEPLADEIKTLSDKESYKSASKLAHEALDLGNSDKSLSENKSKIDNIYKTAPSFFKTGNLLGEYYVKNNDQYIKQSLQAIAIINYKHQEYNNRGKIGKWWYKKSHEEMLRTKANLRNQLKSKGVVINDIDHLGFNDNKNSCSRIIAREINRETVKENSFLKNLNNYEKLRINKNGQEYLYFQNKIKGHTEKEKNIDVKEKVEIKQNEQKQVQKNK